MSVSIAASVISVIGASGGTNTPAIGNTTSSPP